MSMVVVVVVVLLLLMWVCRCCLSGRGSGHEQKQRGVISRERGETG
jgi:hypothetical protein